METKLMMMSWSFQRVEADRRGRLWDVSSSIELRFVWRCSKNLNKPLLFDKNLGKNSIALQKMIELLTWGFVREWMNGKWDGRLLVFEKGEMSTVELLEERMIGRS
jgi:hypothetical protein